jgi:long-chain acyl-CoA synthetase
MKIETLNDVFFRAVDRAADSVMLHKRGDAWQSISSRELYRDCRAVALAMLKWGLARGDRVAILSENRPEWAITDFAALLAGLVDVPVYTTLTPEQTAYILKDSGARAIFVSKAEHARKVLSIQSQAAAVERIVVMDDEPVSGTLAFQELVRGAPGERDPEFDRQARQAQPDDLATIIYTSGTTGTPKGVMLTHRNIVSNITTSVKEFGWQEGRYLSFLPLSHITARHLDYTCLMHGVTVAYCPHMDQLFKLVPEVRPTIFASVPRVYEKVRDETRKQTAHGIKRRIFNWAHRVGCRHMADVLAGKRPSSLSWGLADALVYRKVRQAFGGRVQTFISGGAPLPLEVAEWFAAMSIRVFEGYGLTETSPVIAVNTPKAHRIGTVGRPLPNVECRIAEDGELLVRGPSIFKAYWNLPEETKQAFAGDWFKTGDIASIDADGFLKITDRKKELLKTSGGKFIAPAPIEGALRSNPLVAYAVVVGDRRHYACALIAPNFLALEAWAAANGIPFHSRRDLVAHPRVQAEYQDIVTHVNSNLAQFERLKKVCVLADEFSPLTGELTHKLSLRRKVIEEKYCAEIESLYAEEPVPRQPSTVG